MDVRVNAVLLAEVAMSSGLQVLHLLEESVQTSLLLALFSWMHARNWPGVWLRQHSILL